ncbi:hypothetical protein MUK42_05173 [Musa troglodytarum]|uniref:Uncharacterized protein n=1 Tax=Musa troglodytarum TaxID=320322 RepID=A0A9E7ELN5_9LILI|nr:hypothetical protein MUK42_05173 [Musa troglodytarum]
MAIKVGIGPIRERPNDATATDGCDADFGTCCLKVPLERIRVPNAPTVVVSVCSSSGSSLVREAVERLVSDLAGNGRRSPMPLVDSASADFNFIGRAALDSNAILISPFGYVVHQHNRLRQLEAMAARRAVNQSRRLPDSASIPLVSSLHPKSRSTPLLSVGLVLLGAFLLIGYSYSSSGGFVRDKEAIHKGEGASCTSEVQRAIPFLKKAYGQSMRKVLHIGPDTCTVVSTLLEEDDTEAWGVEPYDLEDADSSCKRLIRKGFVRSADIKFSLPYRPKSFSVVIVSDALDYLSPKYLNKTLPDLARVSSDGLVIFSGYPGQQRAKVSELAKFGKPNAENVSQHRDTCELTGLNCGVHPGGFDILFRLAYKRTKLPRRSLSRLQARGLTNRAARFFTSSHSHSEVSLSYWSFRSTVSTLIYLAVQRCRIAETLCRLSISIRCFRVSNPPFMRISSECSHSSELKFFMSHMKTLEISRNKTEAYIDFIRMTSFRHWGRKQLGGVPGPGPGNVFRFIRQMGWNAVNNNYCGTEVCFSTAEEDNIDDFMAWVFPFVQKTSVSLSFAFADIPTEDTFASYCASILVICFQVLQA